MENIQDKFDLFALVELFGHQKIAGKCTEQNIAGTNMLRVDVPETEKQPAFTRFFGSSAIYAINPIDETTCKYYVEKLQVQPIQSWDVSEMIKKNDQLRLIANASVEQNTPYSSENDLFDPADDFSEDHDDELPM